MNLKREVGVEMGEFLIFMGVVVLLPICFMAGFNSGTSIGRQIFKDKEKWKEK